MMQNIINTVGYHKLLWGMTFREFVEANNLLAPHVTGDGKYDVAVAYKLGVCQGIHEERQRRKGGAAE